MLQYIWLLYRKLLQFGVLEGLVRRIEKYAIQLATSEPSFSRAQQQQQLPVRQLSKYLDGSQCYDEISCHTGSSTVVVSCVSLQHHRMQFMYVTCTQCDSVQLLCQV